MHRQIVDAEDALVGEDFLVDVPHQRGVGGRTQQGVARLHNQLDAGHHNKHRHGQAQKAVQVHAGKARVIRAPSSTTVVAMASLRLSLEVANTVSEWMVLAHAAVEKALPQLESTDTTKMPRARALKSAGWGARIF